jgi:hypothetical protein
MSRFPLSTTTALVVVGLVLVAAIGAGATAGVIARPSAPPTPEITTLPSATPEPDTGPRVFEQPLSAGCATENAVWVFSNGGGIGHFENGRWSLVDATLRSLVAAACTSSAAVAVGSSGRVLTVDERAREIRPHDVSLQDDYYGVAVLLDGAFVVGAAGTVQRQTIAGWQPYAKGIQEDLYAVAAFDGQSVWTVGAAGAAYRLEPAGWRQFPTGTTVALRTIAGASMSDLVAAGDDGVLLRFDGEWKPLASGTHARLRAATRSGSTTYVVGDGGLVLSVDASGVHQIDIGTTCSLSAVFTRANELWFVGYTGTRAGVWRRSGDKLDRWGTC